MAARSYGLSTRGEIDIVQEPVPVSSDLFPGAKVTLLEAPVAQDDTIVSFDPGRTTGIAVARGTTWVALETPELAMCWRVLNTYRPQVVLFERFIPEQAYVNMDALEVQGIVKLYRAIAKKPPQIWWHNREFKEVAWLRGDKLKHYPGMWIPGRGHDRDAIRHLLWHLVERCGHKELVAWSKPKIPGEA